MTTAEGGMIITNNYLLSKKEQIPLDKDSDWMSEFELD